MKKIIEVTLSVNFVKKKLIDKVRDQCHLTGKYRRPAHIICNNNVALKQSSFNIHISEFQ